MNGIYPMSRDPKNIQVIGYWNTFFLFFFAIFQEDTSLQVAKFWGFDAEFRFFFPGFSSVVLSLLQSWGYGLFVT